MARGKRFLQRLLFPAWWIVLVSVPLAAAGLIFVFAPANRGHWLTYPAYAFSAYALTIVCAQAIRDAGRARRDVNAAIDRAPFVRRYFSDREFQVRVSLYRSLAINLGYVVWNLFWGIWYRSSWFWTLAVYHLLLTMMRFSLLRYARHHAFGEDLRREWRRYRFCGIVLLVMNLALTGVVILVVQDQKGFSYPGILIYVMAIYAFYKIITAVKEMLQFRRTKSPAISAAKTVSLATALVSMLALETAMLTQFDGSHRENFRAIMNGCTGGAVCVMILGGAVFMLCRSTLHLKKSGRGKRHDPYSCFRGRHEAQSGSLHVLKRLRLRGQGLPARK